MPELKAGDTKTFEIGGQKLIVEALPYGNLKKIIRIVTKVASELGSKNASLDLLAVVPKLTEEYLDEMIPLLFRKTEHPFLTHEWVDDNLTIPTMKEIILAAIAVNGLSDFFAKTVKARAPEAVLPQSATTPTPPENPGSTISSGLPTDGDRVTLTN